MSGLTQYSAARSAALYLRFLAGAEGEPQDESQANYCCGPLAGRRGHKLVSMGTVAIDRLRPRAGAALSGRFHMVRRQAIDHLGPRRRYPMGQFVGRVPGESWPFRRARARLDVF